MPMIRWKSVRCWSSKRLLLLPALTAILSMWAGGQPAAGSPGRIGTSSNPLPPIQNAMTLTCRTSSITFTDGDSKGIKTKDVATSSSLTFTVVEGQLTLGGSLGTEKLHLVSTSITTGSMFFELLTGDRNAQLWSFHNLKDGRIFFSGHLSVNDGMPKERIVMSTQAGYCDATGGNGQPIRK